ncbi:alpha/beta hydrolase [Roseomonas sp. KE2513]|nr:alpha/beta hydrolase [Roseomonas sp. KE2513]
MAGLFSAPGRAQAPPSDARPRAVPARLLPVPRSVSPALQRRIAAPYPVGWDTVPQAAEEWRALAARSAAEVTPHLGAIRQQLGVRVETTQIAGVRVFVVTPNELPDQHRNRLLVHVHGGGYVLYPGEAGAGEAMLMAGYGRFRVVSVDYRMAPDHPFPAALDDTMAVWRAVVAQHDPRRMAIFGSSAGGGLTLAAVLRARAEGLPLPAAIAPGTPWSDLTGEGDSLSANAFVDNVLVSMEGWVGAAASLYASGHDPRDPFISPVFGDFAGFPPAILTSGTRDLFLSQAVRTHRKLRQAGVEAALQVFEGQSHAQFLDPFVPETEEAFGEIARFFDTHLLP